MSSIARTSEKFLRCWNQECHDVYIVAELSANHNGELSRALTIVDAAADAGVDAVKIQSYTADSLTINCSCDPFVIKGSPWEGKNLYQLYKEAATPWEWYPELFRRAEERGVDLFSTPFDADAVNRLESMSVPIHKVASFEIVDIPLLRAIGETGKPVVMSTGMSSESEIAEALDVLRESGASEIVLLRCVSSYPAEHKDMDLLTIPDMANRFGVPVGLSDHSLDNAVPIVATALGACLIEKHITLSRKDGGVDSSFSLEPNEFKEMVGAVRRASESLGTVRYGPCLQEKGNLRFRRSIFVTEDVEAGEMFTEANLRVIRPADGLHPRHFEGLLGRSACSSVKAGTPLTWHLVEGGEPES